MSSLLFLSVGQFATLCQVFLLHLRWNTVKLPDSWTDFQTEGCFFLLLIGQLKLAKIGAFLNVQVTVSQLGAFLLSFI